MNKGLTNMVAVTAAVLAGVALSGQQPTFEVASVKPSGDSNRGSLPPSLPNGGYSATNVALKSIIANAYEVRTFQIAGDPSWVTTERFDIVARGREDTPDSLRRPMLRSLLADRFKLAAHFETREQQVYALVLARSDGRLDGNGTPGFASGADGFRRRPRTKERGAREV